VLQTPDRFLSEVRIMEWKYSCPRCTAILNPGPNIILLGRHEGREALLAFHSEPGNYEVAVPVDVTIKKGEVWEFFCPVCHETLSAEGEENLAGLDMTDGNDNWYRVIFSRVAGEYATFVITRGPELKVKKLGHDFTKYEHCLWEKYL
jgi:hypothetical protein